jgi:hypothetical protein
MRVNASNERIAACGANSIHKGFQEPIVVGVGAPEERRILGEIKGHAALEEESSGYVPAGTEPDDAPAGAAGGVDSALDRDGIEDDAVAHRMEVFHRKAASRRLRKTKRSQQHSHAGAKMS